MTMQSSSSKVNFPALTSVRALAAWLVFVHHFTPKPALEEPLGYGFFRELHIGVTIFFVLSGFLIYFTYAETCVLTPSYLFDYFRNRAARVYPLYIFVVILTSLLILSAFLVTGHWTGVIVQNELRAVLLQVTFVRGFSDTYKFIGIAQGWSLTVEECFYFFFPFLVSGFHRGGFWRYLLLTYVAGLGLWGLGEWLNWKGFFHPLRFMLLYTFWGRAAEFFVGMALARLIKKRRPLSLVHRRWSFYTYGGLAGVGLCVIGLAQLANATYALGVFHPLGIITNNLFLPSCIALFFYGLITESSWLRVVLQFPGLIWLGKSSYAFYLIHVGVLQQIFDTGYLGLNFLLINALSLVLFFCVEEPCRKRLRRVRYESVRAAVRRLVGLSFAWKRLMPVQGDRRGRNRRTP